MADSQIKFPVVLRRTLSAWLLSFGGLGFLLGVVGAVAFIAGVVVTGSGPLFSPVYNGLVLGSVVVGGYSVQAGLRLWNETNQFGPASIALAGWLLLAAGEWTLRWFGLLAAKPDAVSREIAVFALNVVLLGCSLFMARPSARPR